MTRWLPAALIAGLSVACVTINVYFPAAAAEKAADRIIDDVWGTQDEGKAAEKPAPQSMATTLMLAALDFVVPAAAAAEPNIDISSPEIQRLTAAMEARHAQLKPHYAAGAIGLTADGQVTPRDANAVPLAQRNVVRSLVTEENADRSALYRELAVANGQPGWEPEIRKVFAQRWIAKAPAGWGYQDEKGGWKQK
jgi:uncharacterized protein